MSRNLGVSVGFPTVKLLFKPQFFIKLLKYLVTLAGVILKLVAIEDRDDPATSHDEAFALKFGEGDADGGAVGAHHFGQEIVGGGNHIGVDAVTGDQQPAG